MDVLHTVNRVAPEEVQHGQQSCELVGAGGGGHLAQLIKMQATLGCLSRLVSRSLVTGVVNSKDAPQSQQPLVCVEQAKLVTAVSGFPKQKTGYNIDNILKGQIGDDAYFVARHVDDWSVECVNNSVDEKAVLSGSATEAPRRVSVEPGQRSCCVGADVIGVADGVGGWRQYGVDPGQFSTHLMRNCERLVSTGRFNPNQPAKLLAQGFREMQESKSQVVGSSTACVLMLNHSDAKIYTANMGDSGFLVVRGGKVVHRSQEQQHFFNTPFQLSLPPSELAADVLADQPEAADNYEFKVEDGDVIMLATDGIFDNMPDSLLVDEISEKVPKPRVRWPASGGRQSSYSSDSDSSSMSSSSSTSSLDSADDPGHAELAAGLQQCANSIALIARKLSQDPHFLSPFSQNARANGFSMSGGKEDDITVLLAAVRLREGCHE